MGNYSRRERRRMARQFGLVSKNESMKDWYGRLTRSIQAGRQIHLQFITEVENKLRNAATDREVEQIESLTKSVGEEMAKEIVQNNRVLIQQREEELYQRSKRQRAKNR